MPRYRVAFDGKWQADFDDEAEAIAWATEVGDTGRVAFVVRWGLRRKLIAVFPEEQREVGEEVWSTRHGSPWGTAGM